MNSDDLLEEMRAIAQEDKVDLGGVNNGAYDRLTDGTISVEERALLEEMAHDDVEAMRALQAFAPLGESFKESVADSVLESLGNQDSGAVQGRKMTVSVSESWLERLSRLFSLRMTFWAPALSLCALVVLVLPAENEERSLPQYVFELRSSDSELRSASEVSVQNRAQLSKGSLLDIIIRPEQATEVETAIRTYFVQGDVIHEADLATSRSESGAFRIKSLVGGNFPSKGGLYELAVIIAPVDAMPSIEQWSAHSNSDSSSLPWQLFRLSFQLNMGGPVDGK